MSKPSLFQPEYHQSIRGFPRISQCYDITELVLNRYFSVLYKVESGFLCKELTGAVRPIRLSDLMCVRWRF
jgi:hypothetical protein